MKILVTGASSYVGRLLGPYLSNMGHSLVGTVRSEMLGCIEGYDRIIKWSIGDTEYGQLLEGNIDVVIHLAFDPRNNGADSLDATMTLACNAKVKKIHQIYLSPAIAVGGSGVSDFDSKHQGDLPLSKLMTVIKSGMILGDGGEYQKVRNYIHSVNIFTHNLPKDSFVPVIAPDYLCMVINYHLINRDNGIYYYFDARPTLHQFIGKLLKNRSRFLIRIPFSRAVNIKLSNLIERINGETPNILKMHSLGTIPPSDQAPSLIAKHIGDLAA